MTLRGRTFISMIAISLSTSYKNNFIFDFGHFSFDLYEWYCQHQGTYSDTEKYRSVWCQTYCNVTDANNNLRFEGLDVHYHSSSYQTCSDTNDNVCLNLQTCCYSICTCQTLSLQSIQKFLFKRKWKSRSWIAKIICCDVICVQRVEVKGVCSMTLVELLTISVNTFFS